MNVLIERPDLWDIDTLGYCFEKALDDPVSGTGLPAPGALGRQSMSLLEWWGSNVVDLDLAEVIGIVRDAARDGDRKALRFLDKMRRDYSHQWAETE